MTKKVRIPLMILAAVLLSAVAYGLFALRGNLSESKNSNEFTPAKKAKIVAASTTIDIEIADSPEEHVRGLSNRESFNQNSGMLFVFESEGTHGIWMKEMLFSIDIVWISSSWEVVDIRERVSPDSFPKIFSPKQKSLYVLEMMSDSVSSIGVEIGDVVSPNSELLGAI